MTGAQATTIPEEVSEPEIVDVWSRTSSRYRVRAIVLLAVNLVLFGGLGCFAYWLRTGEFFAPAVEGYWGLFGQTILPRGDVTLANFVIFPIRLDSVPLHGVVVGLLLAALVSIPILISILYRFASCIPFLLVVAFLAVMPWLAITLTGACILASVKPFRLKFRYASALLGLLLVLIYFYGASRQSTPPVDMYKPEDRIKFMAPWVLATLASCVIMGGVLFLARVVNYRPGVVAPLLLVSFAVPVVLFEKYVGRDALYYPLLERRFQEAFAKRNVTDWFEQFVAEEWAEQPNPKPSLADFRKAQTFKSSLEKRAEARQKAEFTATRQSIIADCDRYILYFPDSRYAPNVLYIKGQTIDTRIDMERFYDDRVVDFYDSFPTDSSELTWRRTVANAPDSSISAVARYKLALIDARQDRLGAALETLDELIAKYDPNRPQPEPTNDAGAVKKVLSSAPPDASLRIPVPQTVFEAKQLLSLLWKNSNDPKYGTQPFCGSKPPRPPAPGLLTVDPRDPHYRENLRAIMATFPGCLLYDNLLLRVATLGEDPEERIALLERCREEFAEGDARPEVLLRLGLAYLDVGETARGRECLEELVQEFPDSLWAPLARDRMPVVAIPPEEDAV